ncbi:NAD-dependent epimerase/dehydratase family protein [Inhella proteolytica]|uniref:Epimerase n=1 Tax=Inhella proteolytica TaxID=2795029 RepID=A0A931J8Z0_9BURK|nr:NAD-dependent epimerase/dehydratase family protein [Inhella proteolytica]MBH9578982.1 epimerase [Inhella proteolytica]
MRVLLVGAGGFIGRPTQAALQQAGHAVQTLQGRLDWRAAHQPEAWQPLLAGVDAVIYLPGTVRDRQDGQEGWLERLHHRAPAALGQACVACGVRRFVLVSALCAGDAAYARSKRAGEQALQALGAALELQILQPSLVLGAGGISSRQFEWLSRLPWLPLPPQLLRCQVQPLRVEDLAEALVHALHAPAAARPWQAVGPRAATLAAWIAQRRAARGQAPARILRLPQGLVRASARLGDALPFSSWSREALALLEQDSVASSPAEAARFAALLGHEPREPLQGAWA